MPNLGDEFAEHFQDAVNESMAAMIEAEEAELARRLGAPIFAGLMVEHQMNPLGIERWVDDDGITAHDRTAYRIVRKIMFMQTRPEVRELV